MSSILIAMSGGVDSSVSAVLLAEQGWRCCGARMKLYEDEYTIVNEKSCCHTADSDDARSIACQLGIPYYVFNFTELFEQTVIRRFIECYQHAETPNPCIDCNRFIKFDRFLLRADELNYEFIATGHYAQIEYDAAIDRYLLKRAADAAKDQSYVLYAMTQKQLQRTKFPLGTLCKDEVRRIAAQYGFNNAAKRESQDICFVPDGDYAAFIAKHPLTNPLAVQSGDFVDKHGNILGKHRGMIRYTVGQRKGLGIGGLKQPLFVCSHNIEKNQVVLSSEADLQKKFLTASNINLIPFDMLTGSLRCEAKVRYRQKSTAAILRQTSSDTIRIDFDEPVKGVAPGQAVVLYDGDTVIGGGTIE